MVETAITRKPIFHKYLLIYLLVLVVTTPVQQYRFRDSSDVIHSGVLRIGTVSMGIFCRRRREVSTSPLQQVPDRKQESLSRAFSLPRHLNRNKHIFLREQRDFPPNPQGISRIPFLLSCENIPPVYLKI